MSTRLTELKRELSEKMAAQQEIVNSADMVDGNVTIGEDAKSAFAAGMVEVKEIKTLIDNLDYMTDTKSWMDTPVADSVTAELQATGEASPMGAKSLGQAFVDSTEFKAMDGGAAGYNMLSPFEAKSFSPEVKDVYTSLPSGSPSSFGSVQRDPIVTLPHRQFRIRSLFPARSTNAAVVEYFRQTGFTNNASMVPERVGSAFGLKPQSTLAFEGVTASVRTIAHWEAVHRNALADEAQLRGIIDNELMYGLALREDQQILTGAGTGDDLPGILNDSGISTYSWSAGATAPVADTKADAVRRAITLAYLSEYEPTGVIVHPSDWEDMELTKNSQGTYLLAVSVASGAESRVWRIPVIQTPAIAAGTALVGAFGTGAQLYDRERATIRIAEQHADFFVRNAVVALAEERLALTVKRPEAFVKVTFDAAPS